MSERATRRFRFGRNRQEAPAEPESPCAPCAKQAALRAFALDPIAADELRDEDVPALEPGFRDAIVGAEVVLFDPRRSTSTLLNASAALVWASIDGRTPIATIVDELAEETGVDRATIDHDVRDTISRFVAGGIVAPHLDPPRAGDERADVGAGTHADDDTGPGPAAAPSDARAAAREDRRRRLVDRTLARVGWLPGPGPRRCSGMPVEVRTNDAEVARLLDRYLAPLGPAASAEATVSIVDGGRVGAPRRYRVLRDRQTRGRAPTPAAAVDLAFTELNDLALNRPDGRLVLHAGAVALDGAAVVVAGPSGRGKSTLTAALARHGLGYLTDEVVAIDPADRSVRPYPKPLDLDRAALDLLGVDGGEPAGPKRKVALDELGVVPAAGPATLSLLVVLGDPSGGGPGPSTPGEVLATMLGNTFASTFDGDGPAEPLAALADLLAGVRVLVLPRQDLSRSRDEVLAALAAGAGPA